MTREAKTQAFWWDDYEAEQPSGYAQSMTVEAPERFEHPCGFVRLKERHRVKAGSYKWGLVE